MQMDMTVIGLDPHPRGAFGVLIAGGRVQPMHFVREPRQPGEFSLEALERLAQGALVGLELIGPILGEPGKDRPRLEATRRMGQELERRLRDVAEVWAYPGRWPTRRPDPRRGEGAWMHRLTGRSYSPPSETVAYLYALWGAALPEELSQHHWDALGVATLAAREAGRLPPPEDSQTCRLTRRHARLC